MTITELEQKVRQEINDNDSTNGYRFDRTMIEMYTPDAVRDIYRKRPDIRFNAKFEMNVFTSFYTYDASLYLFDLYDDIFGWDKVAYPDLLFTATAGNTLTASDPVSSDDLFSVEYDSPFTVARVVNILTGGEFGGVLRPIANIASGETFTVSVLEIDIPVDFFVESALVYHVASSLFSLDNEDTYNDTRMKEYLSKFLYELGVSN